jgi:hypothetical protein
MCGDWIQLLQSWGRFRSGTLGSSFLATPGLSACNPFRIAPGPEHRNENRWAERLQLFEDCRWTIAGVT